MNANTKFIQIVVLIFFLLLANKITFAQIQLIKEFSAEYPTDRFGSSVSGAGDVNNDGYDDVIVGAFGYLSYTGRAYIYYGGSSINNTPDVIMTGEGEDDGFGYSVSGAGDINADGFDDVIVGAYGYSSDGRAYIYYGGSSMDNAPDVIMTGEKTYGRFGWSVSGAGDVNNDGYSDIIIGDYECLDANGCAYIYYGGSLMDNIADVVICPDFVSTSSWEREIENYFGYSVSGAGDVNADGYDDVIIGAYGYGFFGPAPNYNLTDGRAYIYYGGSTMDDNPDVYLSGSGGGALHFGYSVSGAGDINADGFDDVIVGAPIYSSIAGRAYIYYGGSTMDQTADVILEGEVNVYNLGESVSGAGDVNGDGFDDVVVGANSSLYNGRTYIFYGGIYMEYTICDIIDGSWGGSVSGAGDVNGDGYDDIIIGGGPWSSNGQAYIYSSGLKNFVVNTTDDIDDGVCNDEHCSLREAINAANANINLLSDLITFDVSGTCPYTIQPLSTLPELIDPVIIDGTTQPGYSGTPVIEIDGCNIIEDANGLTVSGGNSIIRGLAINNFTTTGIFLNIYGGNIVQSNYLGTDVIGTIANPNKEAGVKVHNVPNNLIGGPSPGLGNLISGNTWNGVWIDSPESQNNIVQGNYIGTTADGLGALPNGDFGIMIHDASENIIGGTSPGERNIISGNVGHGVLIEYCSANANNSVIGNYIGTDKTGMSPLPNEWGGISILNSPDNIIGPGNVISGNTVAGIYVWNYLPNEKSGSNNVVKGNLIGTNAEGTEAIGNDIGIFIGHSWENIIGGADFSDRNIISGNLNHGIEVKYNESVGNKIFGNYIGTDITGTAGLGNGFSHPLSLGSGVFVWDAPSTIIGRNFPAVGNLISGNVGNGIYLIGSETINTEVYNNKVGSDKIGKNPIPNSYNGLLIDWLDDGSVVGAANNSVIKYNLIAFNSENGIEVAHGIQNLISGNSIFSNELLGIDLGNDGVTANDIGDPDSGPNNYQNYPRLDQATAFENVIVEVSLYSSPNTEYKIEFFKNTVKDYSSYGEGKAFIGNITVTTNSQGTANFERKFVYAEAGDIITATATDPGNNTSEFSKGKTVSLPVFTATQVIDPLTSSFSSVNIPPSLSSVTFHSTWPGSEVVMTLTTPSGQVIDSTTSLTNVIREVTPTSEKYIITEPEDGKWDIELYGKEVDPGGEIVSLIVSGEPKDPLNTVFIDVQPGDGTGTINCTNMQEVIPVAILTTADFDATQIDHTTVYFGACGSEAQEIHYKSNGQMKRHEEDVNEDGYLDLVFHFLFEKTGIQCGDEYATLTGFTYVTYDGKMVRGTDAIRTVGLNKNSLSESDLIPTTYNLQQCFPNPFNPTTVIRYELPEQCFVRIEVFNSLGQLVSVLKNDLMQPGYHEILFNGNNIPSGVYFYRIKADSFVETKKMVLMK